MLVLLELSLVIIIILLFVRMLALTYNINIVLLLVFLIYPSALACAYGCAFASAHYCSDGHSNTKQL